MPIHFSWTFCNFFFLLKWSASNVSRAQSIFWVYLWSISPLIPLICWDGVCAVSKADMSVLFLSSSNPAQQNKWKSFNEVLQAVDGPLSLSASLCTSAVSCSSSFLSSTVGDCYYGSPVPSSSRLQSSVRVVLITIGSFSNHGHLAWLQHRKVNTNLNDRKIHLLNWNLEKFSTGDAF